ncbi:MAG: PAS domain S-box protein [Dehalococcoidales bacterium]|nr:PAS domain S-box protein [Dehalococcoidales bacterium]
MNLISKAILIVGAVFICGVGLVYAVSRFIFIKGLEDIEQQTTSVQVEQAVGVLNYLITDLETDTADWARWDDTYRFIEDRNEEYIQSNMVDTTFTTLKLNTVLYIDLSGIIVYSRAYDIENNIVIPVSDELLGYFSPGSPLLISPESDSIFAGILEIDGKPVLVSTQPVLTSNSDGPARGTLVFCRLLNETTIDELSGIVQFPILVYPVSSDLPQDILDASAALATGETQYISPLGNETVAGYTMLDNIFGQPTFIMKIETPRDTYRLGEVVSSYYIFSILGIGILTAFLVWYFIQRRVISRIALLISGVNRIAETGDTSTRIALTGTDEVSIVAGTIDGMLGALEEAGKEIRASETRYRLLSENVMDVIWSTDQNVIITYMSPSVFQLTGFRPEELVGTSLIDLLDETERTEASEEFSRQFTASGTDTDGAAFSGPFEVRLRRKDGSTIITEVRPSAIKDADGNVTGFVGITRDIVERKHAQNELEKLYAEEKVLRQSLEEEIQKRVEFTRALVHELKTPITPILAAVELLLEEVDNERLMRLVQSIDRSSANLNLRIDELLDLARGEMDMLILNTETIDILSFFNDLSNDMIPVALSNRQTLEFILPESLPHIQADRGRLRQIVTNLLNNAFKFTPEGGTITLRVTLEGRNLRVEVSDNGPGISEEDLKRLFQPYFRRTTDRDRLSGLGLGLALSKFFIELHGGQIKVESELGKGSVFCFTIPVEQGLQE